MRALITGAAGFVGRHMLAELQACGWDTTGVDINPMLIYVATDDDLPGRYQHLSALVGDARDIFSGRGSLGWRELSNQRFDLVVHCAYHVGGRAAIDGNPSLLALNLELDAQLFDWAVRTRQHAVMYFSSSAAYPTKFQDRCASQLCDGHGNSFIHLAEHMVDLKRVCQPDARYGWAKLTGEHLAAAAAEQGLRVHVLRPFSGYGHDQNMAYPFPAIVKRVLEGDMSVWGPPGQMRDWIHIDDVVDGALAVYQADFRQPVNLCTGIGTEFGQLATMIAELAGIQSTPVIYREQMPMGVMARVGDPTRMLQLYEPRTTLADGIHQAIMALR